MNQKFIEIPGYNGRYRLFKDGYVLSFIKGEWTKICHHSRNGYLCVTLWSKHVARNANIHRLLATYFIQNPNNYPMVNHKDGNKINNNLDNLEWCTAVHNTRHAHRIGLSKVRYGIRAARAKIKTEEQIKDIRERLKNKEYQWEIAKSYNVSQGTISNIARNKTFQK